MSTTKRTAPAGARQNEAQQHRRTMQRLLGTLAVHLPAQQPGFKSAFLLEYQYAKQAQNPDRRKGA